MMSPHPSKMLLVFCDGTGMDGNLTYSTDNRLVHEVSSESQQYPTNVLFLSRAVKAYSAGEDPKRQIVLYISGVGSQADFNGYNFASGKVLQAFGTTVASKIRDAYAFLAHNYEEGDEICLFGFSRGAYTVRKVAGLIDKIGLLRRESLGSFFGIWKQLTENEKPTITHGTLRPRIKCVGIWDTVGATFDTVDALNINDNSHLPNVDIALHALSLQENRDLFLPNLWRVPKEGLGSNFKQIWFPGVHSDVGGGYQRHELSDLALIWMVGEIQSFINLDTIFIQRCLQPNPEPWGMSQPHNEGHLFGNASRLGSEHITRDDIFHESLKFAPTELSVRVPMITLDSLRQAFGPDWRPKWAPLNSFEKYCRDNWGMRPPSDSATFESSAVLLDSAKGVEIV